VEKENQNPYQCGITLMGLEFCVEDCTFFIKSKITGGHEERSFVIRYSSS